MRWQQAEQSEPNSWAGVLPALRSWATAEALPCEDLIKAEQRTKLQLLTGASDWRLELRWRLIDTRRRGASRAEACETPDRFSAKLAKIAVIVDDLLANKANKMKLSSGEQESPPMYGTIADARA